MVEQAGEREGGVEPTVVVSVHFALPALIKPDERISRIRLSEPLHPKAFSPSALTLR
jgi:hypothetical protein